MHALRATAAVALVTLLATGAHAAAPDAGVPMLKQDAVAPLFGPGPTVNDPGFDAWLRAVRGPVKLPFTIWREPRRVGAIGVHASPPAKTVGFSDGALGVPLDERLRMLCGDAEPCRVWLSGRFGEAMPLPVPEPETNFNVYAVHERVEGNGPHGAQSVRGPDCLAIRALKPLHCARGPKRCERCKAAEASPAVPKLLDLCPWGEVARPVIELKRGRETQYRPYDVMRSFADAAEARAFAQKHGLTDVELP
ncbi:MAG: hypothetical protein JNJ54_07440 [Myxococcaceae bacterium]|nr:hypothetical protein [Myxococcaceae bacterium]